MIARWIVHVEIHRGYRPRLSVRRAPCHGDRVVDGGVAGILVACRVCSGVGFLHRADEPSPGVLPQSLDSTVPDTA